MRRGDRRWEEMLARLLAFRDEHGHFLVPRDWEDRALAVWMRTQRSNGGAGRLREDRRERLLALGFSFTLHRDDWERRWRELSAWKRRHGHCAVPRFHREVPGLGVWVSAQRALRREGRLLAERRRRLDALGFVWERHEESWRERLRQLDAFRRKHGHARVPKEGKHLRLGQWLAQQRHRHHTGRLGAPRTAELLRRGVMLDGRVAAARHFDEQLAALERFKARFGHLDPPGTWPGSLRAWTLAQRARLAAGKLAPDQARRLRALGLEKVPRARHAEHLYFEKMFAKLEAFHRREGHCRVPQTEPRGPLGSFVSHLRTDGGRGRLPAAVRVRLNALGFSWDPWQDGWERGFALLEAFRKKHGHVEGPFRRQQALSNWVTKERRYYRQGKLPAEQVRRLEALGFLWVGHRGRRARGEDPQLGNLKAFRRQHRHFLVPAAFPWKPLHAWCEQQRALARAGRLPREVRLALEQLGFPLTAEELAWERLLASVVERLARGGPLTKADGGLFRWLERQRELAREGELELDGERRLAELGLVPPP